MSTISGLSPEHRAHARNVILAGVRLCMAHQAEIHYSMGPDRWEGINSRDLIVKGEYPKHGDCSSTATWLLWNALHHSYGVRDVVNGTNWTAGFTGTIAQHGKRVHHDENIQVGDLILYGPAPTYEHVTVATGGGRCFSHGGEAGPFILPIDYRRDRGQVRRFI